MRLTRLKMAALLAVGVPGAYIGAKGVAYLLRSRSPGRQPVAGILKTASPITSNDRILIIAPHPDDETLGCGGLIQNAVAQKAQLQVVFLTNGDGFRVAAQRQLRTVNLKPTDYVRFAEFRQQEARSALKKLGLPPESASFFGYPDRGLMWMWLRHWDRSKPFRSNYTETDVSPYRTTFQPKVPYSGELVVANLRTVMRSVRPTRILVTHPSDDHPDHAAASAFVRVALAQARLDGEDWVPSCGLAYYLIHRGDWPEPQGLFKNDELTPPIELLDKGGDWSQLPLSIEQAEAKESAIETYRSQTAVMRRFLSSFVRRTEATAEITDPNLDARIESSCELIEPTQDNLLRDFQAGGDIQSLRLQRSPNQLVVKVETAKRIAKWHEFALTLHAFSTNSTILPRTFVARTKGPLGAQKHRATFLEFRVPIETLEKAEWIALVVESSMAGVQIDRSAIRWVHLSQ